MMLVERYGHGLVWCGGVDVKVVVLCDGVLLWYGGGDAEVWWRDGLFVVWL